MTDVPSGTGDPSADGTHGIMDWPRIPGYQIEARVGAGGMAMVFRARDERLRRPVALKILASALAADDGFRRRFVREARAAAMVDHPHIIPVFEAGESDRLLFIAMRFVAGGDVRSLLSRSGAMSAGRATGIVSAVASALDAAHRAGLVHRDVKPANMLIDVRPGRPDHVYLSDFGLSKGALSSGGVTRAGHVVGTPAYLAPEQAAGGKVDGRADQYSLTCVAYELLTGMPPFPRDDAAAMIYAHLWEPPPQATAQRRSLPSAVDSVLARAMSKDPERRFLTCQEFADSLRAALGLRPYCADPGMNVREWEAGAGEPARLGEPDGPRDAGVSNGAASEPPRSPERIAGGESAPRRPDHLPLTGRARARRRVVRVSLTALTVAALTVAGVVAAVRASRSPEPVPVLAGTFKPVPGQLASVGVGPHGQLLVAGYTCGECGTPAETDRPLIVEQNGSAWSRLAVPGIRGSSRLTGVSVSADGAIYAVGYTCQAHCGTFAEIDRPLILQWRGGAWSRFSYLNIAGSARLTGVSVTTTGIVFAVGYTCLGRCATSSEIDQPIILRSDGSSWSRVSSPSLPRRGTLSAVSSQHGDAWAVGGGCTPVCQRTLILHWHDSAWSRVASPSPGQNAVLYDVSITAAGGWASGWSYCSTSCPGQKLVSHTLILHWNGHSWSQDRSPDAEPYNILYGISGAAGHAAWAVGAPSCGACGSPPVFRTVILRWNGSDWSRVTPSPGGKWPLTGIAAEPGGGAIAVGRTIRVIHACTAPCDVTYEVDRTLILRWNGSRWSAVR